MPTVGPASELGAVIGTYSLVAALMFPLSPRTKCLFSRVTKLRITDSFSFAFPLIFPAAKNGLAVEVSAVVLTLALALIMSRYMQ